MAKIKSSNVKSFYIISNDYSISKQIAKDIKQSLISQKYCFDSKQHNLLFVVGGDGTFVRCLRKYYNTPVRIICINTGTVGFYARFKHDN
jgi:NAD+ kinase